MAEAANEAKYNEKWPFMLMASLVLEGFQREEMLVYRRPPTRAQKKADWIDLFEAIFGQGHPYNFIAHIARLSSLTWASHACHYGECLLGSCASSGIFFRLLRNKGT